jgi:hypothetical protein
MAERVTVEHNGELVTLEVPDGTSDEQIKSFLGGQSKPKQETPSSIPAALGSAATALKAGLGPVIPEGMPGQIASKIGQTIGQVTPSGVARGAIDLGLMAHGQAPWGTILKNALPEAKSMWNQPIADSMNKYIDVAKAVPGQVANAGKELGGMVGRGALKAIGPAAAAYEGYQAVNQARQGDYPGAAISGASALSALHPLGLIAQPGLAMMRNANENFRQQTPQQQNESAMAALSGTAPGMAGEYTSASQTDDGITRLIRIAAAKKALASQ